MNLLLLNIILILFDWIILQAINPKKARKYFCIIAFIQLFVFHAFLDPYKMYDLPGYLETYESFRKNSLMYSLNTGFLGVKMEPGWIVMCKLLTLISSDPFTTIYFSSIVIVGLYCLIIYRFSAKVWLSVYLFLCTTFGQSLFVIRQHMAIAICLASVPFIINRIFWKFALLILVATSIHFTAIVFVPLYFLYSLRLTKKFYILFLLFAVIGWSGASAIFMWFFEKSWYVSYLDAEGSNLTNFSIMTISLLLYLFVSKWNIKAIRGAEKCFFLMLCLGVILSLVGAGFSPTNRLIKYYYISMIFIIPYSLNKISEEAMRVVATFIIMVAFMMLFYSGSNTEYLKDYTLMFLN